MHQFNIDIIYGKIKMMSHGYGKNTLKITTSKIEQKNNNNKKQKKNEGM